MTYTPISPGRSVYVKPLRMHGIVAGFAGINVRSTRQQKIHILVKLFHETHNPPEWREYFSPIDIDWNW